MDAQALEGAASKDELEGGPILAPPGTLPAPFENVIRASILA